MPLLSTKTTCSRSMTWRDTPPSNNCSILAFSKSAFYAHELALAVQHGNGG